MFNKKNKPVNKIIHLNFIFNVEQLGKWAENDFKGDLLETTSTNSEARLSYTIDLVPHPNGIDTLFYHRATSAFSNHLDAFETKKGIFREYTDRVDGVEWTLHHGHLLLFVLLSSKCEEDRKSVLSLPTDDIFQMQIHGDTAFMGARTYEEKFITVAYTEDNTEKIRKKILRPPVDGVSFSNLLCEVVAYPSTKLMDYNNE